jgi:hypothetical protein
MNNIQLATTLGSATGTGFLFVPFSSDANSAVYKQSGAAGRPATISFKRVLPKPNGDNAGVERCEVKLTEYLTVGDAEHTIITTLTSSVPVPVTAAQRTAQVNRLALLAGMAVYADTVEDHAIPV